MQIFIYCKVTLHVSGVTASCKMGTGSFPGVKCGRRVLLTTYPLLVLRLWKSRAIPLPTLWATGSLYLYLLQAFSVPRR